MAKHLPREPIGTVIGNFTLLEYVEIGDKPKGQSPYAKVRCSCGVEKVTSWKAIRSGVTKSCGHLKKAHPIYKTSNEDRSIKVFYTRWTNLKARFSRKDTKQYRDFKEKGITLAWNNYREFYDDMNESFESMKTRHEEKDIVLYRRDDTKGFNKHNCYWGTKKIIYPVVIDGKEFNGTDEISEAFDIPESTVISRMYVFGYKGRQIVD